ncbi:hypothetical protein LguiA_024384 [Lonicera macranthoides]
MTMHSVYVKEHENPNGSSSGPGPWWTGLGSQPEGAYGGSVCQLKTTCTEQQQPSFKDQERVEKANTTHQFTIFPGDCKSSTDGQSFPQLHAAFSVQSGPPEYRGRFELGFGQPVICAKYPYGDQCYGVFSTYGPQITGRIMLPLSLTTDDGPIYVNAKQYHGIIRRRQSRAKAELENKAQRNRKPYLHLSRHLHAMRRPRGCGGRFLNTKKSDGSKKTGGGQLLSHPTASQSSEVLQSDSDNLTSPRDRNGNNRSNLSGSEVTSMFSMGDLNRFPFNNLQPSILSFSEIMNAGHGSMVMPSKWIAAAIPSDSCCNLKV